MDFHVEAASLVAGRMAMVGICDSFHVTTMAVSSRNEGCVRLVPSARAAFELFFQILLALKSDESACDIRP